MRQLLKKGTKREWITDRNSGFQQNKTGTNNITLPSTLQRKQRKY